MENNIKEIVIAKIVGTLVNEGLSAHEAIYVLEQAENTFLDRSYHINSKKKNDRKESSPVARTTSKDFEEYTNGKITLNEQRKKYGLKEIKDDYADEYVKKDK